MKTFILLFFAVLIFLNSCQTANQSAFNDVAEIEQVMQDYRNAWRKGDSSLVLNKLSKDIILFQPGKGGKPVMGKKELSNFWFPTSDISYPIVTYNVENSEISGSGDFAYYQGTSKLTWCTLENNVGRDTTLSVSEFTNILKKEGGNWKIYRIMYNLKDQTYSRD
ncbi:MAG: nuclear transport factor 2 family protein [Calditrichota bacterium]